MNVLLRTSAALLTSPAPGAIAVVAIAGANAHAICEKVLRTTNGGIPSLRPDRPILCGIMDGDDRLDDVVVVRSGVGKCERIDLCTHGGMRIVQRVLDLLARRGADIIEPERFFELLEDANPIQKEVDLALLGCNSRRMATWLLSQRAVLPEFLPKWKTLKEEERARFLARSRVATRLVRGLSVAIVGPPNAGKSTLANRLIGHERVITSDVPGTTRDWVSETALVCGWPVTLTDTAGVRETSCEIETEAIARGTDQARAADLVVVVLDAGVPTTVQLAQYHKVVSLISEQTCRIVAFNKCDLPRANAADLGGSCRISAMTGEGIDELEKRIEAILGLDMLVDGEATGIVGAHL
jgi:tRNA modification GTPase